MTVEQKSVYAQKRRFVTDVLSPLMKQAQTAWIAAQYLRGVSGEYVYLINEYGHRAKKIDVTGDSLAQIVRDVFANL